MFGPEDEEDIEDTNDEIENEEGEVEDTEPEEPEVEIPAAVRIVQAAINGDAVGVSDAFKQAVGQRAAEIVQDRKEYIANNLINPDAEEVEDTADHEEVTPDNTDSVGDSDASEHSG